MNSIFTGNIAVDMITKCLAHYKQYHKKVKYINLSSLYWKIFSVWVMENKPDFVFDDTIEFNNVTVRKGHSFMKENLEAELETVEMAQA